MQYVLFDVETTGLGKFDEVIQFCCFTFEDQFKVCKSMHDFYCMTTRPISPKALAVHNITAEKLRKLSDEKFFEEYFYELKKNFSKDCMFIYYSFSGFDMRLVNQTLQNQNLPAFNFGKKTDSLRPKTGIYNYDLQSAISSYLGKRRACRLEEAVRLVSKDNVDTVKRRYLNFNKAITKTCDSDIQNDQMFHNARFDVFCMWYLLSETSARL